MIREEYDDDQRTEAVEAVTSATVTKTQRPVKRLQPNDLSMYLNKKRRQSTPSPRPTPPQSPLPLLPSSPSSHSPSPLPSMLPSRDTPSSPRVDEDCFSPRSPSPPPPQLMTPPPPAPMIMPLLTFAECSIMMEEAHHVDLSQHTINISRGYPRHMW